MVFRLTIFTAVTLGLMACTPAPKTEAPISDPDVALVPITSDPAKAVTVHAYMKAFNERDVDAMLALATDDVEWISLQGKDLLMGADGSANLRATMVSYFQECASCRSSLKWTKTTDKRVVALEEASWDADGERKSQTALSVYEFEGEKIQRVYYFPAE